MEISGAYICLVRTVDLKNVARTYTSITGKYMKLDNVILRRDLSLEKCSLKLFSY